MVTADAVPLVLPLGEVDRTMVDLVGGKGASLGELSRMDGTAVPAGFCVTTEAYRRAVLDGAPRLGDLLDRLEEIGRCDREATRRLCAAIRDAIEAVIVPDDLVEAVAGAAARHDDGQAWAVRSSATAEDRPAASFAGQHDSWLDIVGPGAIIGHIRRCWASLFTERAVTYRHRIGVDHRRVRMAVVVQRMVRAEASGVAFTADPVTSNRRVVSIEAVTGPGEAFVSGRVNVGAFQVRAGEITAAPADPVLDGPDVLELAAPARHIEAHFGCPQDIEWCRAGGRFAIVQSRPITTLFPVPERGDGGLHVYVSVGHGQMMTDPMKPLGLALWQLTALAPMHAAGGRLFVDVTARLASPEGRSALLAAFGRSDPLIQDALRTAIDRTGLGEGQAAAPAGSPPGGPPSTIDTDPDIVSGLIDRARASVAALRAGRAGRSGPDLVGLIRDDVPEAQRILFDRHSQQAVMAGMEATWWLNDLMERWLGEKNAADVLTRSAPRNITSQMGLDLLDVADVIRPHADVVTYLAGAPDDFLTDDRLTGLEGGLQARDAVAGFLDTYGMRNIGEIDITRPRWSEQPAVLLPVILGNIKRFEPGEAERRFERGRQEAEAMEARLLTRLRALPGGDGRAAETRDMIERVRTFIGYREYPKYSLICRYAVYKEALLELAADLVAGGVLAEPEDVFHLTLDELQDVASGGPLPPGLVAERKVAYESYAALAPPRVLTSDGEAFAGSYGRPDLPPGALAGVAVSAGAVEGRARVIGDMADADVGPGDILVTAQADPGWSPLFLAVSGLVTEIGGLMTHGAVIAREYGLPAVVGVERATEVIRDGQRIRLDGTQGYVELLDGL